MKCNVTQIKKKLISKFRYAIKEVAYTLLIGLFLDGNDAS